MFRRSRFSVRPNVGTAGRTAAPPQEAPSATQEASETPKDVTESSAVTAATENKSVVTPSEKTTAPGDGNEQSGDGTSSSAAVQRRKRFSIKPKVAPGRPSTLARTKSPVKAVSETPTEASVSDLEKPSTSSQTGTTAAPQRLQSPRRQRLSEESKQPKMQLKPTLISSDSSEPSAVPTAEDSPKQTSVCFSGTNLPVESGKESESVSGSQVEEVPSRPPDKVPPSLPDKEAIEISEKAKTLVSSKSGLSLSPPAFSLSRLLNDPSDLQRLAKARKLRELLKQEMHKEKKIKKVNARAKEYTLDPTKMTMRDLIRYLPLSNPMTSSLEDSAQENETVVPPSPVREASPERAQEPNVLPKLASPREEEEGEAEEEQDEGMMVPQVKVAEDGSLIIDEESLTVEVQRSKGPNPAQDRDPIFERGSTTTYSSFRKGTYSKPWSNEETDMFFLAISMVGTDFSMICQLFPHRARSEIKNKFKKEERENSWRIDKAFRERRKLDIEYFSKLLEKILEVQKNRKKLKSLAGKKSSKKPKKEKKGRKAARKLSVVEEEDEEEQNEMPDLEEEEEEEEEGEKENEDLCNEGGTAVAKPKKKRKRRDASTEESNVKKNKTSEKSNEQDEAYIPGDTEAALPEDRPTSDVSEKADSVNKAKDTTIKPAKLSRGRAPKPLLPLGRKWGKKAPPPSTKTDDTVSDKGDEGVIDGASKEQVNKDASPLKQANKRKSANDDSEEEDATVQSPRPTRYGRVPKPTKPLNYPAKEAASETTPASPGGKQESSAARPKPKCTAKRGRSSRLQSAQESKKPKLVTLRASQLEYSDEEDEQQQEEEEVEEQHAAYSSSTDSAAPVFVPASLRSPHPVISEVEETMEELDILANMPDVLGISQDALCPDASFELAQNETGTAEPCEHQLDLLVDVIDLLSSDHTEVTEDESYNEAAQTLLTIGNLTHLSQSAQNQRTIQGHIAVAGTSSVSGNETSQRLEEEIALKTAAQEENSVTPHMSATSVVVTETSETVTTVELQNSTTDNDDIPVIESSDHRTASDMDPTPQLHASPESSKINSPQTSRGCLSKVKPKPDLGQASWTAQSKCQPETSTVRAAEDSDTVSEATETLPAAEETPKIADCSRTLLKDELSCVEVRPAEESSGSQKTSVGQLKSGTSTSNQSASEIQNLSETQFKSSRKQATSDSRSTSESTYEFQISHVGTNEVSCDSQVTSSTAITEVQIGRGSNVDPAPVQNSNEHPAPCVTPVEESPVSQEEESEVGSTRQIRMSRFQRVKPKVNLVQSSRTTRSKPQTTKDTANTSPENPSQSPGPASDLIPSLDLDLTPTPTEELSTTEEKRIDVGVVVQVKSSAATSHQSAPETQNLSEAQFEPNRKEATGDKRPASGSKDEVLMSLTTESSCNNLLTSALPVTESQAGQGSNIDPAPVQENSDHPVIPVEELPVSQKEESEVGSTCQTRKSRFQRVKPKVNLPPTSRTARSKPQTTKDTIKKDFSTTPNPKFSDKTIVEIEAEPTSTNLNSFSDVKASSDLCSTPIPTEELSTTEGKKTEAGVVGQVESDAVTAGQSVSENQNLSETQFEPSRQQVTRDTTQTLESTNEVLMPHTGTTGNSCKNQVTSDAEVTESQIGQGLNIDPAPVQESNDHPAPCVTPVEELPVSRKEESEVGCTSQTRKSRFQRVKPKVSLAQTLRTACAKPQTTKDTTEKDSNLTPHPKFNEKTTVQIEAEPICITSPEKSSQSCGPASDLIPSLDLGSTLTPTQELSTTEEKKTNVGVAGQVESGTSTSQQSAPTNEVLMSYVGTSESNSNNLSTSDLVVAKSQVGQGSNVDSAPVQESNDHPVTPVEDLPVRQKEESEVRSTRQTRTSRFQRVKPKVNLVQSSRTARFKSQTTKETAEEVCNPTLNPKFQGKTVVEVEAASSPEKTIQSPGPASDLIPPLDLGSTLTPTEELSTAEDKKTDGQLASGAASETQNLSEAQFEPSREQATRDTTLTSVSTHDILMSHVGTTESSQVRSDPEVTESKAGQGSPIDPVPVQESSDERAPPVEELPVSLKESEVESTRQATRGRLLKVKPKPNLSQTLRTVRSKPQTTEDPVTPMQLADKPSSLTSRPVSTDKTIAEVEAQSTCSSTAPETPSQIKSTGTASVSVPPLELCSAHKTTEELSSVEEQKTDVGCGLGSNSEGPEQNVPQRRRRFPKVKPNLGPSPRATRTKLQSNDISKTSEKSHMDMSLTSEQQPADNSNAQTERELADSKYLTSKHRSLRTELLSSTKSLDCTNEKGTSSDGGITATSWTAENQSVLTDSVLENKSSENSTVEGESTEDTTSSNATVECGLASQWDCKLGMSIRATDTNTLLADDPTAVSHIQSTEDVSTESKIESNLPANNTLAADPKESTHQPHSENDSKAQSQDALQQCSEMNQTARQSTNQSEPTDSSGKAPQTRRGRLIKPKPRLGLGRRRPQPQPQQIQNTKQADADFDTHSEGVDASVCHKVVSEHQPAMQEPEPVEGAVEPLFSNQNTSPNVAGSSLGCVVQVAEHDTQDASTSSTGATQSLPSFTIFPDMLSQQEPSDPDEPFFILSLTEIPVGPSGEVVGSVPEPLPYLAVTDASIQQHSVSGESLAAAGDGPLSDVAEPVAMEESGVTGLINVKDSGPDPAAYVGWIMENPADPHESTAVHPPKLPETVEKNNETDIPLTKQRGTRRREAAKLQVKPNTRKRKQASTSLAAKEAESVTIQTNTGQHSELPGPSVQPKANEVVTEPQTGSGDHVNVEKETWTGGEDPEGSSSRAQTRRTSSRNRKAKEFLPFISETNNTAPANDSPPGKAASKGRKVRAPPAVGKRSTPAPVASTSYDDAPACSAAQPTQETHSTSSTSSPAQTEVDAEQTSEQRRLRSVTTHSASLCPAEVSASQHCVESSSIEEEPTSVSQYFLSDIFTEVEEG